MMRMYEDRRQIDFSSASRKLLAESRRGNEKVSSRRMINVLEF
jgi:hypothetical protein